ncbi:uncharacterized protein CCOS01_15328 [Colletotrichum costaricense]|uniref:Uncharacterized protein n=1 Tax=Colletotrichum costaricense TaxID=1209916 RepID=A0AAI9YID9_9PEZI|nr:uncharacterized protein CCOS01_15328 [Colletotrichum costaricense]KAK1510497.1 hypothetical protein CCOS01_15328 [Colletotrichum costaricense]
MLDKMMEHGNGEVFICVVRLVPGPPSSQLRGQEIPAISAIPSSDVPPAPSGTPPPLPLESSLLPPLEPPLPTSLESVPSLSPSPKQGVTESTARSSRALSIQIKSEVSPGVETGRQATDEVESSNRRVARPAGPKTVRQAPAQDNDRQVVQSCSARGHHLLDCVWPDARGDLVGCPFCNTQEHVMDLCPQQPSFDEWGWAYILIYGRANKPLLRTTRSWFHYAHIGHRFTSADALDLKTAAEWRSDSASQNHLKRDPETMNSYVVFSNMRLMDERFNPNQD